MKKRGFTLIELLAVIVILAIIALIAIPQITKVVDEAKKGAAVSSAYGYIDAVEKYMMTSKLSSNKAEYELKDNIYDVIKESNNIPGLNTFIKINGEKPVKGSVTIEKGKVKKTEFGLKGYRIVCQNDKCNVIGTYEEITITYNLNGGTLDKTSDKVYKGDTLILPIPKRNDYEFDGWYTDETNGTKVTNETLFNKSQTIYAHWIEKILSSISLKTMPTKISYVTGESLDLSGIEVIATYTNGREETLDTNDIISLPTNNSKLTGIGEKEITITYGIDENAKSTSFNINISPIRFEQSSSNTLDYKGYDGNLSTYVYTMRNGGNWPSQLSGIPKLILPENTTGYVLNFKYVLDAKYSQFSVLFADSNNNIIGRIHRYYNPTEAADEKIVKGQEYSDRYGNNFVVEDIQNNNVLAITNLIIPENAKFVYLTMGESNNGAKIYDTYITAP